MPLTTLIGGLSHDEHLRIRMQTLRRLLVFKKKIVRSAYKPKHDEKKIIYYHYIEYFDKKNKYVRIAYNDIQFELEHVELLLQELNNLKGWDE